MAAPMSPTSAHRRARLARLSRGRAADAPEVVDARRDFAAARLEDYIERVLADAPPLTEKQRTDLAELLRPVRA